MTGMIGRIRRWRAETVSRRQLARMDSRVLADLGIAPVDFERVARRAK